MMDSSEKAITRAGEPAENAPRILELIKLLTNEEGNTLCFPNPNPDFDGPAYKVWLHVDFDCDDFQESSGESLLECLEKAYLQWLETE